MNKPAYSDIFSINNTEAFDKLSLSVFAYQAETNPVYKEYLQHLKIVPNSIKRYSDIPFLPISFFKTHEVITEIQQAEIVFSSSGTTGMIQSRHLVSDVSVYTESFTKAFECFYGQPSDYCFLALLPSYLEREGSSLILMIEDLIKLSGHEKSGFFLHNHEDLYQAILEQENNGQKTILIGVTYALLDFIEKYPMKLKHTIVMETGGMKGKRKEMVREELHDILQQGFGVSEIHSEYGMTELLSQGYSDGKGIFRCPPWMKVLTRDTNDPLTLTSQTQTGGVNIIDLSNINSCSFIATQDLGKVYQDGSFEILGRFDNSDIRGCNLLVQ
ncbi:LuxE/PaaK family acyltransferase [Solitalea canadensis]|uniref:Acyl-CoA synthetase (AMP-forming)/AMP-acid ligase II n=1 Tax=Solitalea canadensis (strain ATCC 29591 / DSM 3403 / JCM 21819 / LMG 8368 / NBRC 15130 / NCIMB 12057 / USAM 9D) TaxID=929556 RepID=H8KSZ3_SOLCM|nr:acyltransferase [Solitalea canadensis]AFD05564.1 acyl-CoA synthetase (AMP-forming)/AMP-acid ligase II [Solitalea canadensis DSM 3403]